jgi:hypothetical protein
MESNLVDDLSINTLAITTAADEAQGYQYKPLMHSDEIRILILAPDDGSNNVRCTLKHVRLSDKPQYEGLSYVWGDPSKPRLVMCDGCIIRVTESLHAALRYLRLKNRNRVLWADDICINQEMDTEKNHQVALMGKIYSQTSATNIWLGEDEDNSGKRAFEHVQRLAPTLEEDFATGAETQQLLISAGHTTETEFDNWIQEFLIKRVLGPIFRNPWFSRLWCLQEAALSSNRFLIFGGVALHWDVLRLVCYGFRPLDIPSRLSETSVFRALMNFTYMDIWGSGDKPDILRLLRHAILYSNAKTHEIKYTHFLALPIALGLAQTTAWI